MPAKQRRKRDGPVYLIEHMEEGLEEWPRLEYTHMCEIVPPERLLFTRWPDDVDPATLSRAAGSSGPPRTTPRSLKNLRRSQDDATAVVELAAAPISATEGGEGGDGVAASSSSPSLIKWDRVCLLDMDAEEALEPSDCANFDILVFGGILGNVHENEDGTFGSDDRTSELRDLTFVKRRHLGPMQMSTDTALLVCHLVLEEARTLSEIPWVDSPEIGEGVRGDGGDEKEEALDVNHGPSDCVCMEGFRYVARRAAGGDDWEPTLPKGMRELLINSADNDLLDEL